MHHPGRSRGQAVAQTVFYRRRRGDRGLHDVVADLVYRYRGLTYGEAMRFSIPELLFLHRAARTSHLKDG